MTVSYFIVHQGGADHPAASIDDYRARVVPLLAELPRLRSLSIQAAATYDDPFLKEKDGPLLVAHLEFATAADLERALKSDARRKADDAGDALPGNTGSVVCQAMKTENFAAPGGTDAAAPACYFVQYRPPAEDAAAFVSYYRDNHPALLAELPGIRQVAIYTPMDWADAPYVSRGNLMLINLVAFDSLAALNAALHSEARLRLREDYASFPPFTGKVSHTAMLRDIIVS